jgi:RHS repeat-associated protein
MRNKVRLSERHPKSVALLVYLVVLPLTGCERQAAPPAEAERFPVAQAQSALSGAPPSSYSIEPADLVSAGRTPGATPFASSVGQDGQAQVTVPVILPPGRNGMAPSLAFQYSSSGPDGHLGIGWSVPGAGRTISRCQATPAVDGVWGSPTAASGALCLEGMKLVPFATDEYRTELESYTRIKFESAANQWIVQSKSGIKSIYGWHWPAAASSATETAIWRLTSDADAFGNTISYTYGTEGEISQVSYGANAGAGLADSRKVDFVYEGRKHNLLYLRLGHELRIRQRLKEINVSSPTSVAGLSATQQRPLGGISVVRKYKITYQTFSGDEIVRDVIASISECDSTSVCKAPVEFEASKARWAWANERKISSEFIVDLNLGDTNGDGRTDLIVMKEGAGGWHEMLQTSSGTFGTPRFVNIGAASENNNAGSAVKVLTSVRPSLIDLDLDGVPEVLAAASPHAGLSDPSFGPSLARLYKRTVTGDYTPITLAGPRSDLTSQAIIADIDGDARPEILDFDHWNHEMPDGGSWENQQWDWVGELERVPTGQMHVRWNESLPAAISFPGGPQLFAPRTCGPCGRDSPPSVCNDVTTGPEAECDSEDVRSATSRPTAIALNVPRKATEGIRGDFIKTIDPRRGGAFFESNVVDSDGDGVLEVHYRQSLSDLAYNYGFSNGDTERPPALASKIRRRVVHQGARSFQHETLPGTAPALEDFRIPAKLDDDSVPDEWQLSPNPRAFLKVRNGYSPTWTPTSLSGESRIADLDADGRDDLLYVDTLRAVHVEIAPYFGADLGFNTITGTTPGTGTRPLWSRVFRVGDLNGDALPDLIYSRQDGVYLREHLGRAGLIRAIKQSGFTRTTIGYKPLLPGDNYTPGTTCSLPQRCVTSAPQVVSSVDSLVQESGTVRTTEFSFEDGRTDVAGRGWLGFTKVIRKEAAKLTRDETTYNLTPIALGQGSPIHAYSHRPVKMVSCVDLRVSTATAGRVLLEETSFVAPFDWKAIGSAGRKNLENTRTIETRVTSEASVLAGAASPCASSLVKSSLFTDLRTEVRSIRTAFGTSVDVFEQSWLGGIALRPARPVSTWTTVELWPEETTGTDWRLGLPKLTTIEDTDEDGRSQRRLIRTDFAAGTVAVNKTTLMPDYLPSETPTDSGFTRVVEVWRDAMGSTTRVERRASGATRRTDFAYETSEYIFPVKETKTLGPGSQLVRYSFFVPSNGNIAATEDWNGLRTTQTYDTFGRRRRSTGSEGYPTTLSFSEDSTGHVILDMTEDTTGGQRGDRARRTRETLDIFGRTTRSERTGWGGTTVVTTLAFDDSGQLERQSFPFINGGAAEYAINTHDKLGRRVMSRNTATGDYSEIEYEGLSTTLYDPARVRREVARDSRGRPIRTIEPHASSTFRYAPFDTLESIVDQDGNKTRYEYDELGRRKRLEDPNAGISNYRYNGFGEIKRIDMPRGGVLTIERDLVGRETTTTLTPGQIPAGLVSNVATTEWDTAPNGKGAITRRTSMDGVVTAFGYDGQGRINAEATTIPGTGTYVFSSQFDARGNLSSLTYPDSTRILYARSAFGELQSVFQDGSSRPLLFRIDDVNVAGQILKEQFGNGVETRSTYDASYRLSFRQTREPQLLNSSPSPAFQTFKYDYLAGRISARHDLSVSMSERFEYDDSGRLEHWGVDQSVDPVCRQTSVRYSYGGEGNLTLRDSSAYADVVNTYPKPGSPFPDAIETSKEGSAAASTFTYDEAGNQSGYYYQRPAAGLADRETSWTYFNLPRAITDRQNGGSTSTMTYDATGNRVLRTNSSGVKEVSLGAGLFTARIDASGTQNTINVKASGRNVAQITKSQLGSSVVFVHADDKGSPDATSGGTIGRATLAERAKFDPFGERRNPFDVAAPGSVQSSRGIGFTGHQDDAFVTLTNMQGRIYDQHVGRFLSADPIALSPFFSRSRNGYSYVVNDPINQTDPTGYFPIITLVVGLDYSSLALGAAALGVSMIAQQTSISQDQHNSSASAATTNSPASQLQGPLEVSPPNNAVFMGEHVMGQSQATMEQMALDPNQSWGARATAGVLGVLVTPLVIMEPLKNAPWVVHNAGIHLGERAGRMGWYMEHGDGWDVAIEGSRFTLDFVEGFEAGATIGALAASVGEQLIREVVPPNPIRVPAEVPNVANLCEASCFPAGTLVSTGSAEVRIESLRVGDLVQSSRECVTPSNWTAEVTLDVVSPSWDGAARVVLLRPPSWAIAVESAGTGTFLVSLPDLGAEGEAHLVGIRSRTEPIQKGCVVTGTIVHAARELVALELSSEEVIYSTPTHPLFSATRRDWVQAGLLEIGESLEASEGNVRVKSLRAIQFGGAVYNLEVADSHEYQVGDAKVRAHNTCACGTGGGKTIGLGLDETLANFRGTGALTYKEGAWQQSGLTRVDWGRASMDESWFRISFKEAARNAQSIAFDVTGFEVNFAKPGLTSYEFNTIINDASLLQKTTFVQNGSTVIWNGTGFVSP